MTRPSAKNRDLTQGDAPGVTEAQVDGAQATDAGAPSDAPGPFPTATSIDPGVVPEKVDEIPAEPAPAKTADELQMEARIQRLYDEAAIKEAQHNIELAELRSMMADMAAKLGKVVPAGPSEVHLRSTTVNQDVFAANWAKRKPGLKPEDAPILGKTFKVIPQGQSAKDGMPIATVSNASDSADAKACYGMKFAQKGQSLTLTTQEITDSAAA